jgi:para-aminobenzoate synthetase component 1
MDIRASDAISSHTSSQAAPRPPAPFAGVVESLDTIPDMEQAFVALSQQPHCIFFDSARFDPALARFSFLSADPFAWIELTVDEVAGGSRRNTTHPFDCLRSLAQEFATETVPQLPPFQGGIAGLFTYGLLHAFERVPRPRFDEFEAPALALGFYDVVLAVDHVERRAWIISQGWPEKDVGDRRRRAAGRLQLFKRWLRSTSDANTKHSSNAIHGQRTTDHGPRTIVTSDLAPQFPTLDGTPLTSNFSRADYLSTVERAIEYIRAGDVFQVNLAQRLLYPARDNSPDLYLRLRRRNPATFATYFDFGKFQIASASPERFLQVRDRRVEARPIKGTRRRSPWPEADLFAGDELLESEKDRAENVMIVDLLRNDLSRVCDPDSVQVADLCRLETYEFVQHLVSVVQGTLNPEYDRLDLLAAAFPGGSITGAPKVRAMEIIAELEPTARGPYCGSLGYLGFDGTMDTNILIRTITAGRGWWQFPVGGGIVAQSDPQREYEETWHKAEGILRAIE